jgi:flagellar protein FliS
MSYSDGASAYMRMKWLGSTQEQVIPLLYEQLLTNLRRAGRQIELNDLEGKAKSVEAASTILLELLATLNFDEGGEVASRLAALYSFFLREIGEASRTLDVERIGRVSEMIGSLHDAWVQVTSSPEANDEVAG